MNLLPLDVDWESFAGWFGGWESYGVAAALAIILAVVTGMVSAWRSLQREHLQPTSSEFMGFGMASHRTMPR